MLTFTSGQIVPWKCAHHHRLARLCMTTCPDAKDFYEIQSSNRRHYRLCSFIKNIQENHIYIYILLKRLH